MMKHFRLALLAATAGIAVATAAIAADENKASVDQSGNQNVATIDQTSSSGHNTVLSTQTNDTDATSNTLTVKQIGTGGYNSVNAKQNAEIGAGTNTATITQKNGSVNRVTGLNQTTNAKGDNIATISVDGSRNRFNKVIQNNTGKEDNTITATIVGSNNGANWYKDPADGKWKEQKLSGNAALSGAKNGDLVQNGTDNAIKLSITGDQNLFGIDQTGDANELSAISINGAENQLGVVQVSGTSNVLKINGINGDNNNIGVIQNGGINNGVIKLGSTSGETNGNLIYLEQRNGATANINIQDGDNNDISATQLIGPGNEVDIDLYAYGTNGSSNNYLRLFQEGSGNFNRVAITGSDNNQGSYTTGGPAWQHNDIAHNVANSTAVALNPGDLLQYGDDNEARFTITGSNNLFAMLQDGDDNSVKSTMIGNFNELAVVQEGNGNEATFTQSGSNNTAGLVQVGSNNVAVVTQ